jgi:hypothetical protein
VRVYFSKVSINFFKLIEGRRWVVVLIVSREIIVVATNCGKGRNISFIIISFYIKMACTLSPEVLK